MVATNQITVIEVPSDVGSVFSGKSRAAVALKSVGLVSNLEDSGCFVNIRNALPDGDIGWMESTLELNGLVMKQQL